MKQSGAAVEKLVGGVSASLDTTRASIVTIGRLESVGRNVEKIVNAISLVVVQISMLAVSGAVEAARAGDAGRGFAVVSNDIRGLANEAAESADRIKETVGGILEQIASLRRDLEQIVDSVEVEVQNNRSLVGSFEKVNREAVALASANQTILQGAEQILEAATQSATRRTSDRVGRRGGRRRRPSGSDCIQRTGKRRGGSRGRHRGNRIARRHSQAAEWLSAS